VGRQKAGRQEFKERRMEGWTDEGSEGGKEEGGKVCSSGFVI
jgi:hypothetical protein